MEVNKGETGRQKDAEKMTIHHKPGLHEVNERSKSKGGDALFERSPAESWR